MLKLVVYLFVTRNVSMGQDEQIVILFHKS